jgi:ubiquitin-conjugating enzyme E2 S
VSLEGEICVNTLKKDWNPKEWNISHIFQVIKCLLINPFPESSLNDDAGRLFMDDYDEFGRMAKLMTSIHAAKKTVKTAEPDVEMKPVSPVQRKYEDKEDQKPRFGGGIFVKEDLKQEDDGEPLQSLHNNMCFNNSPSKVRD